MLCVALLVTTGSCFAAKNTGAQSNNAVIGTNKPKEPAKEPEVSTRAALTTRQPVSPLTITAYSYHISSPFVRDQANAQGLNYELIRLLQEHDPALKISLQLLPRLRLDRMLESNDFDGMVLLVDPSWFSDAKMDRYVWTDALIHDANIVVSRMDKPIDFRTASSLSSRVIGGVRGYRYDGLDFRIRAGWTRRVDVNNEPDLLRLLSMRSVDAVIMSRLSFYDLTRHETNLWFVANKTQQDYQRRILISASRTDAHKTLCRAASAVAKDEKWKSLITRIEKRRSPTNVSAE